MNNFDTTTVQIYGCIMLWPCHRPPSVDIMDSVR